MQKNVAIDIDLSDVLEFINLAGDGELKEIRSYLDDTEGVSDDLSSDSTTYLDSTLDNEVETAHDLVSLLHREKIFYGGEAMIERLKEEAQRLGFIL